MYTNKAVLKLSEFKKVQERLQEEDAKRMFAAVQETSFDKVKASWMFEHDEVIKHWPPQYIVGKHLNDQTY